MGVTPSAAYQFLVPEVCTKLAHVLVPEVAHSENGLPMIDGLKMLLISTSTFVRALSHVPTFCVTQ